MENQRGLVWLCPVGLCPHHVPSWGSISPPAGSAGGDPNPPHPKEGQKILLFYQISSDFGQAVVHGCWQCSDSATDGVCPSKDNVTSSTLMGKPRDTP